MRNTILKRIACIAACLVVMVPLLCLSVFAEYSPSVDDYNYSQWEWIWDRRNDLNASKALDPDYDYNKTPDIVVTLNNVDTVDSTTGIRYMRYNYGYLVLNGYDMSASRSFAFTVPVMGYIELTNVISDPSDPNLVLYIYRLKLEGDDGTTRNFYRGEDNSWSCSWYPNLKIYSIECNIYLNDSYGQDLTPTPDFEFNQFSLQTQMLAKVEYPFIGYQYYLDSKAEWQESAYNEGYDEGFFDSYLENYNWFYDEGYAEGYDDGLANAPGTGWMNFKNLIFTIFDAPFYVLNTAFNFELFGINIAGTFFGLITILLLVWIFKKFI